LRPSRTIASGRPYSFCFFRIRFFFYTEERKMPAGQSAYFWRRLNVLLSYVLYPPNDPKTLFLSIRPVIKQWNSLRRQPLLGNVVGALALFHFLGRGLDKPLQSVIMHCYTKPAVPRHSPRKETAFSPWLDWYNRSIGRFKKQKSR